MEGTVDIIDDVSGIPLNELIGNKEYDPTEYIVMGRTVTINAITAFNDNTDIFGKY